MKELIASFPEQLVEALAIFQKYTLKPLPTIPKNVLISGLGGSGIGGTIVSELSSTNGTVPILVTKDYALPGWVTSDTLVIISSYSGNTEETLAVMHAAVEKKAMIVCVTSGGEVLRLALEKGYDALVIPGGNPPRACLAYSLAQLCGILEQYKIVSGLFVKLENAIKLVKENSTSIIHEAEAIARSISYSLPVIYTTAGYEGIAIRLRQQLNENAKMLCWHHVVPEMNHNELVGWVDKSPKIAALFLRNQDEYYRTSKRMEICQEIISSYAGKTLVIDSKGESALERMIYWIHLGDWISWFCSVERNVDSMEIKVINRLKGELSELK
jgi:glucose/mannose-6-phosphate isomerase